MLYLELEIIILSPLEGNDKKHKMNAKNNRLEHPIYQLYFKSVWAVVLHSCKVWWIRQSVYTTWMLYVQLCNYSNNFCLMESFFQNILQCDREKHLFVNFHTDICSIYNYSFGVFFSKYQLELIYVFSEILF